MKDIIKITMIKEQLPIMSTNSEPPEYKLTLEAKGYYYLIDDLYKKLTKLLDKKHFMQLL